MSDTLGRRIDAMFQHYIRDDFAAPESREALIARADAAERLAVAADTYSASCLLFDENDHPDVAAHYRESTDEYDNALAAWRAITGEVQP